MMPTRSPAWPAWLLVAGLLARRRRTSKTEFTTAFTCVLVLASTGCSGKENPGTSEMTNTGEPTTSASSDTDAGSGSSGPTVPTRLYGVFHSEDYTDGLKWEQPPFDDIEYWIWWGNVVIEPDSSLRFEYYFCGGPPKVQSFTWEPDGDGIRVVPPNGEGTPFEWSASSVLQVWIKPGEFCGEILVQALQVGAEEPTTPETYIPGHLCTIDVSQTECEFEFKWCEGPPAPPVCE
jgi:hypothetical protein